MLHISFRIVTCFGSLKALVLRFAEPDKSSLKLLVEKHLVGLENYPIEYVEFQMCF